MDSKGITSQVQEEIKILIRARYPILYIVSYEENRVTEVLQRIALERGKTLYTWTVTKGLIEPLQHKKIAGDDPISALDEVLKIMSPSIFVFYDFHPYLNDHTIIRKLREVANSISNTYKTLVFVSPILRIPLELEKDISVIDYPLPSLAELRKLLHDIISEIKDNPNVDVQLDEETEEKILHAAQGLSLKEAENVFAKALIIDSRLSKNDIPIILSEKQQIVKKSQILEYYDAIEDFSNVGGLENLKNWLLQRGVAFTEKAKAFGLPAPKGVLLIGVQGCGKSLCAKAISSLWKLPLLKFDVGKIFSSLVGSSEDNIRRAIKIAESVSPCILWIDEIEKAFAGTQSSNFSDAGTTSRVFGSFITWLQDKKSDTFVVATANDISQLPPELMRKGRFDEIFFIDLPTADERKEIFLIHLAKRKRDPKKFDLDLLAKKSEGFSGAEIEQVVISSLFDAFHLGKQLSTEIIISNLEKSIPLVKTMSEEINALRKWAEGKVRYATPKEKDEEKNAKRRIEI